MSEAVSASAAAAGGAQPASRKPRSLMICAGDISGDQHAAKVVAHLKKNDPDLHVWGVGGPELEKAGAELLYRSEDLAVIGIFAVVKKLPLIGKMRAHLLNEIEQRQPDAVMLVDYGGFNLNLAQGLNKRFPKLPLIYFISPQVWGSRPWRLNVMARCISKALVIFPFEEALYRNKGIEAHFVGHPLTDKYADFDFAAAREQFFAKHGFSQDRPLVGLFPGSRSGEIRNFMQMLLQAVQWLHRECPDIQFAMSQANPKISELIHDELIKAHAMPLIGNTIKLVNSDDNLGLMAASDVLWTKSGTTTLEAAIMEKPMLVYYRGDWLSFSLFLLFKRVKYVAWPNLLAGKMLVPELIQLDCRAEQLVRYTRDWLDVPAARADIIEQLRTIKAYFRKGDFASNAAAEVEKTLAAAASSKGTA